MRAASRASELSCSYSLETIWTQRGNSSTFARLRPRSKIRILGSGTPRLNLDLGYGCAKSDPFKVHFTLVTNLVLAIAITSRWSSRHFEKSVCTDSSLARGERSKDEK